MRSASYTHSRLTAVPWLGGGVKTELKCVHYWTPVSHLVWSAQGSWLHFLPSNSMVILCSNEYRRPGALKVSVDIN